MAPGTQVGGAQTTEVAQSESAQLVEPSQSSSSVEEQSSLAGKLICVHAPQNVPLTSHVCWPLAQRPRRPETVQEAMAPGTHVGGGVTQAESLAQSESLQSVSPSQSSSRPLEQSSVAGNHT